MGLRGRQNVGTRWFRTQRGPGKACVCVAGTKKKGLAGRLGNWGSINLFHYAGAFN